MKKKSSKAVFFIVLALIIAATLLSFLGISVRYGDVDRVYVKGAGDIRWGIDIRGGVDATFTPPAGIDATPEEMEAAKAVIEQRLVSQNITDSEVYVDTNKDRVIVRFPWKSDETDFNPEEAIKELGETASLTFREGYERDEYGKPSGVTKETIVLEGKDVKNASAVVLQETGKFAVSLELNDEGAKKFATATSRLKGKVISIWMDDTLISYPEVNDAITDGKAIIESPNFTAEDARSLANKINAGALPFKLETENFNSIDPTLGEGAKDAMVLAGLIAYIAVCILMIVMYKLPGVVASIALLGQISLTIACITGFFPVFPSFTLTLPGIAGIILSIGIGVDANVITAERIKEELALGKTLEGSIDIGYKRAFTAIFDGNITVIIVALILMGSFGPPSSVLAKILTPIFFMFGPSTAGAIYSFGYTLMVGVILNFIFGVTASRLMLKSLSKFRIFRNTRLYGGAK